MFVLQLPFCKRKPQDVVVCYPWKWSGTETRCHLLPLLFTLVLPGDGFFFAYGPCWHLTSPSRNNADDSRIGETTTSALVADNPQLSRGSLSCCSTSKRKEKERAFSPNSNRNDDEHWAPFHLHLIFESFLDGFFAHFLPLSPPPAPHMKLCRNSVNVIHTKELSCLWAPKIDSTKS